MQNPTNFSCKSSSLADITNRREPAKHRSESSEDKTEGGHSRRASGRSLSHSLRWSLRRRNSSDRSVQPLSAPSGADAQQSENFKKFYRAVVSPTHIRVTAGGRIVPNTRTAAPPTFEWNAEKHHFDQKSSEQEPSNPQTRSWLPAPLLPQGGYLAPYPFVPMPQVNPMAVPPMPSPQGAMFMENNQNSMGSVQGSQVTGEIGTQQPGLVPQQIKISPPTQFDQSKPFMINGQLVYPAPPGFQLPPNVVPVNMIGNPNFAQPQFPMAMPMPMPMPFPGFHPPIGFPPGHQLPMMMPNSHTYPEGVPSMAPFGPAPMPAMTSLVDLTRSHIQGLRNTAHYIESQLANNQHQVDEAALQNQRSSVLAHISQMESLLEQQVAQENKSKPRKPSGDHKLSEPQSHDVEHVEQSPVVVSSSQYVAGRSKKSASRSSMEDGTMLQVPKMADAQPNKFEENKSSIRSDSTSKSRLSAAAAKAPPFQPRAQLAAMLPSESQQSMVLAGSHAKPAEFETQTQVEARLLSRSSPDWGQNNFSKPGGVMRQHSLPKARSMIESSSDYQTHKDYALPAIPRALTFHGEQNFMPPAMVPTVPSQAVPYLIGVKPQGVPSHILKDSEFVYPRPLTTEELRARHLYWGQASVDSLHGLPKFDGRNFYPASPVKAKASMVPASDTMTNRTALLPDVKLLTGSGLPGYRAPSAAHLQSIQPNLMQMSSMQPFYNNSMADSHGAANHRNPSMQYTPRSDAGREPVTPPAIKTSGKSGSSEDSARPAMKQTTIKLDNTRTEMPVTPKNSGFREEVAGEADETDTLDSWGGPAAGERELSVIEEARNGEDSNDSTVEIHLSPQTKQRSPKPVFEGTFAERVASFST